MIAEKVTCPGCDRKFNSIETMTNHGRSIHWWSEKQIDAMKREHKQEITPMNNQTKDNLENATARPWKFQECGYPVVTERLEGDTIHIAPVILAGSVDRANAALIVRAVNSHDALVEACCLAVEALENEDCRTAVQNEALKSAINALKLAKGE